MPNGIKESELLAVVAGLEQRLARIELLLDLDAQGGGGRNSKLLGEFVEKAIRPLQSKVDAIGLTVRTGSIGKRTPKKKAVKAK